MPMYPDTSAAIERIRAMQRYMPQAGEVKPPYEAPAPQIEVEAPDLGGPGPMDMPSMEQINAPVYGNDPDIYGLGQSRASFTAPEGPSKRDRIAAALQKRRQMQSMPYGG